MQNTIQSATEPCFRVEELLQLTPEEAGGRHHVLVDVLDDDGQDLRGQVTIRYGWDGMQPEETPLPMALDKPANEPGASIPVWPG
jgi:chemotaxis regulatin CheY-phosphate phosphatase CheZ